MIFGLVLYFIKGIQVLGMLSLGHLVWVLNMMLSVGIEHDVCVKFSTIIQISFTEISSLCNI